MQETTINITNSAFKKIERVKMKTGLSQTKIIVQLIDQIQNSVSINNFRTGAIEYQKEQPYTSWQCIHLFFSDSDYERCLDLRRLLKKSLSLIIAQAIDQFLNEAKIELSSNINREYTICCVFPDKFSYDFYSFSITACRCVNIAPG